MQEMPVVHLFVVAPKRPCRGRMDGAAERAGKRQITVILELLCPEEVFFLANVCNRPKDG